MNILEFVAAASQPTMAQETIRAIIKTRHIPTEDKRDLAELTFNKYDGLFMHGTLLNEPNGNFGYHCGDSVTAFVFTEGEDSYLIAANFNA